MVKENNTKRPLVSLLSTEFIERIVGEAKDILEKVELPDKLLLLISRRCKEVKAEGQRPDVMLSKTSKTLAAYDGRTVVTEKDIKKAAKFILPFRMTVTPFAEDKYSAPKFMDNLIDRCQNDLSFGDSPGSGLCGVSK